ncbi:AOC03_06830 family ribosome hibernation factor [Bizionia paragorgiae]|uniref:ERF1 domain-containing protein 3 n=1 Tax=Bizionia paragorgiae TaxID=283786 RepID=A0A1H4AUL7_BIZPA|nr:hypothetical protein [Bizionia paragorgiae]SEA39531.1 hypothetical protein SAMN04487990_11219 [Bizionia paragorgiae]
MNATLKKLKNISSENCITIIMNTHRTKPGYLHDELTLKNLIKEAENRLVEDLPKPEATRLVEQLKTLAAQIDYDQNLDSLVLFVNEDIAEFTRLPVQVTDRVVIDTTFSTRDLIRAMHKASNYYVLVLSQEKVRLIEAFNDKVVKEIKSPFPIENTQFTTRNTAEASNASRQTHLKAEFFNQVDKAVNAIRKQNPLPVLICTVEENFSEYLKVADEKNSIFNVFLNKNRVFEKDHAIVSEAWKIVADYNRERSIQRKTELLKAVSENTFLSDTFEIWNAIKEGRVETLFVENELYQPAIVSEDGISFVSDYQRNDSNVIDDIYDEMMEMNMDFGGDVVFLPQGELAKFNGFGAITRY